MKTRVNLNFINLLLVFILAAVILLNVISVYSINTLVKNPSGASGEIRISLTAIQPVDCEGCADLDNVIDALKQSGAVTVTDSRIVKSDSAEGKALIVRYSLTQLPAMVLEGDTDKLPDSDQTERVGDVILLRNLPAPWYDLATKTTVGIVDVTYLVAPACKDCNNITLLTEQLAGAGVAIGEQAVFAFDSVDGLKLRKQYNITAVPSAIFSADAARYPLFVEAWKTAGTVEADGSYVMRTLVPPYYDIATKKVRGLVKATYLTDTSCPDCYDPAIHKGILGSNFGITIGTDVTVDLASAEGKKLVAKYNITLVPTVLLSGDTAAYPALNEAWQQIGTVETDGTLVFRKIDLLQGLTYKDLSSGVIIRGEAPDTTAEE